jgi:hypothetical protein
MGNPLKWAAFLVGLAMPTMAAPAEATSWIGWCANADGGGPYGRSQPVFQPQGGQRWLTLGTGVPEEGCRGKNVPVAVERVIWFGPLPGGAGRFEQGISLQGPPGPARFDVSEIQFAEESPPDLSPLRPMPLAVDILPMLDVQPFGTEERATLEREPDHAVLSCRSGDKPAGFILRQAQRAMPVWPGLSVRVRVQGDGRNWQFGLSDAPRQQQQNPLLVGALMGNAPEFSIPDMPWGNAGFSAMVECPRAGGTLAVSGIELLAHASARATVRSAWMWRPADWRESATALFDRLARHDARIVYVTVPIREGAVEQPDRLGDFIASAGSKGIAVWVVLGDPHAVLPSERARFAQWAQIYAAYNVASPPERRLAGLQLDIEPYLLPGYAQDPAAWDAAYVEAVNLIAKATAGLPVEVAVPVWFGSAIRQGRVLDRLAPDIQTIAVMDYRTDERQIIDDAVPFLTWGRDKGKGIRIAVEFGALPDEEIRIYRATPAQTGELWRIPLESGEALVLLDQAVQYPAGTTLSFVRKSIVPGNALTFHGSRDHIADILRSLEAELTPWPSFLGMAIHGMD